MTRADSLDEAGDVGIEGRTAPYKVGGELGVGQIENPLEEREIVGVERRERILHERVEHSVELVQAAPAAPAHSREIGARRTGAPLGAH